ncbi:MAG: acetate/propionate family kinase [Gemmatimonadota bacterium]
MNVLVLNVGSSTVKFQVIRTDKERIEEDRDEKLATGLVERIGGEAVLTLWSEAKGSRRATASIRDIRSAIDWILKWLASEESGVDIRSLSEIEAVGHRMVHGGESFSKSVLLDADVIKALDDHIELAPLHMPYNLAGVRAVRDTLGDIPQSAVFDTAFHSTLPETSYLYAIPYSLYRRHKIRRYGFHGTSHRYVAYRYRQLTGRTREDTNIITLHLGNGCSACAIQGGRSVDTSMGFTPLEGLVMGTRSGDVDPAILDYIAMKEGLELRGVENLLNKQSGLLGISGLTHDMRELLEEADEHFDRRARLAIEMFCYRARKYIGSYLAAMGGAQALVFTGGIGQNASYIRAAILEGLEFLGVELDDRANADTRGLTPGRISRDDASLEVWVIPTDEELLIARDTVRLVKGLEWPS